MIFFAFKTNTKFSNTNLETMQVEISGRVQILDSSDLLVSNVRDSDAGLYKCIRSNEAGSVEGEAYLGVMGKKSGFFFF